MSSIANCDWPEEYPDLLTSLISLLSSNSPDSVHGAMQVLTEFIKSDLTEDQILPVLRDLLPVLLSILGATEVIARFIFYEISMLRLYSKTQRLLALGPYPSFANALQRCSWSKTSTRSRSRKPQLHSYPYGLKHLKSCLTTMRSEMWPTMTTGTALLSGYRSSR